MPPATPPTNWRLLALIAALLGGMYLFNEHNFHQLGGGTARSREELLETQYMGDVEDTSEQIETGSTFRRVSFPLLGVLGVGLALVRRRPHGAHVPSIALAVLLYLWCVASLGWSETPELTAKRLLILSCSLAGVLGVSRLLTLRELAFVGLIISTGFVLFSVAVELALGVFEPWTGAYRFAGIVHPNTQGGYCATMFMSAFTLWASERGRWRPLLLTLLIAAFTLLVLTKSRSTLAGLTVACVFAWSLIAPAHKRAVVYFTAPLALLFGLGLMTALGHASSENLATAASLGREEGLGGLNGRVPLWGYLLHPIGERPLAGYGYDSFWTPDRIERASAELDWTIPNSHNTLVEVLLNLGLVGGLLFVALAGVTLVRAGRELHRTRRPELLLPVSMGVFAAAISVFEASYSQPTGMDAFLTACALTMASILPTRQADSPDRTPASAPAGGWGRPRPTGQAGLAGSAAAPETGPA